MSIKYTAANVKKPNKIAQNIYDKSFPIFCDMIPFLLNNEYEQTPKNNTKYTKNGLKILNNFLIFCPHF